MPPSSASDFDFPQLVAAALRRERKSEQFIHPARSPASMESPLYPPATSPEIDAVNPLAHKDIPAISLSQPAPITSPQSAHAQALPASFRVNPALAATMFDLNTNSNEGLSNIQRKKLRMKTFRQLQRANAAVTRSHGPKAVKACTINKHVRPAAACSVDFDGHSLKHTQHAWTGGNDTSTHKQVFSLNEMVGPNSKFHFTLERWDGKYVWLLLTSFSCLRGFRSSIPIIDSEDCVIAVLAGCPDDDTWSEIHLEAADALENSRDKLKNPSERDLENRERRGHFPQEAAGESMGGGQKVNNNFCMDLHACSLVPNFVRFLGHSNPRARLFWITFSCSHASCE